MDGAASSVSACWYIFQMFSGSTMVHVFTYTRNRRTRNQSYQEVRVRGQSPDAPAKRCARHPSWNLRITTVLPLSLHPSVNAGNQSIIRRSRRTLIPNSPAHHALFGPLCMQPCYRRTLTPSCMWGGGAPVPPFLDGSRGGSAHLALHQEKTVQSRICVLRVEGVPGGLVYAIYARAARCGWAGISGCGEG